MEFNIIREGMLEDHETLLRMHGALMIKWAGLMLKLPGTTTVTALMIFQRFFSKYLCDPNRSTQPLLLTISFYFIKTETHSTNTITGRFAWELCFQLGRQMRHSGRFGTQLIHSYRYLRYYNNILTLRLMIQILLIYRLRN